MEEVGEEVGVDHEVSQEEEVVAVVAAVLLMKTMMSNNLIYQKHPVSFLA